MDCNHCGGKDTVYLRQETFSSGRGPEFQIRCSCGRETRWFREVDGGEKAAKAAYEAGTFADPGAPPSAVPTPETPVAVPEPPQSDPTG